MRYASIRELDISNGKGIGVALFVQGCRFACKNCFNPDTWDFNGGKEWTEEVENKFLELAARPYIKRISILGGEPLAVENLDEVLKIVNKFRLLLPDKTIWIYSGYQWEQIFNDGVYVSKDAPGLKRRNIVKQCTVMVDGRYIDSQRDITLKWRGSTNQRVIDINKTLENKSGKIIIYTD